MCVSLSMCVCLGPTEYTHTYLIAAVDSTPTEVLDAAIKPEPLGWSLSFIS